MSADLDAVRKAYSAAYRVAFRAANTPTRTPASVADKAAHDAGLVAVVEWAMNRALDYPDDLWTVRTALLKDLTDNPERKN